jgi:hypothetical protein
VSVCIVIKGLQKKKHEISFAIIPAMLHITIKNEVERMLYSKIQLLNIVNNAVRFLVVNVKDFVTEYAIINIFMKNLLANGKMEKLVD